MYQTSPAVLWKTIIGGLHKPHINIARTGATSQFGTTPAGVSSYTWSQFWNTNVENTSCWVLRGSLNIRLWRFNIIRATAIQAIHSVGRVITPLNENATTSSTRQADITSYDIQEPREF